METQEESKVIETNPEKENVVQETTEKEDHFDYKKAREATEKSMESTLGTLGKIDGALDKEREKLNKYSEEYGKKNAQYGKLLEKHGGLEGINKLSNDEFQELPKDVQNAYNELAKLKNEMGELQQTMDQFSSSGMKNNLKDQITYMEDYLKNLETLKEWGLSDTLLASLSDGSKESAQYLQGLVDGGKEAASEVDSLFAQVQEKKKGFTDTLTEQKLTVDETYNAMVEKAKELVEQLDLGEEANDAMGNTMLGIISGIRDNVSGVSAAVTELMNALAPLDSLGFRWGFEGGSFVLELDGSHETGLDYVPFSGYLAELHEGEGILTAEENRIWQRFKNGQSSSQNVDYDALGGIMRDNVHAGGNVYLDGRTVGKVISDVQGNQYRSLQRSGWQQ